MQYVVLEYFSNCSYNVLQGVVGPFPSRDQADQYCDRCNKNTVYNIIYRVHSMHTPTFMPEKIHG
jgi:hypothetical protein